MKFEVKIWQREDTDELFITFRQIKGDRLYLARPIELVFDEYEWGAEYEPTLRLPWFYAHQFLRAMAEALDKSGIKTDNDAKLQGILEAKSYHLEDLRTLLKLRKK